MNHGNSSLFLYRRLPTSHRLNKSQQYWYDAINENIAINMDNGMIHIIQGIKDSRIYGDLVNAFENRCIGKIDDLLHNNVEASKIYVTSVDAE